MALADRINQIVGGLAFYAKLGVLVVVVAIIGAVYYYKFWTPKVEELEGLTKDLKRQEAKLREYKSVAAQLPEFEKEYKRLLEEFKFAVQVLPEEKEIPELIDNIYSEVSSSGLEPRAFAPKAERQKELYAEIPVSMSVVGSYHELAIFFDKVSRLSRIVNVRDLNLKPIKGKGSPDRMVLDAGFTAVTFRMLPESEASTLKKKRGKRR